VGAFDDDPPFAVEPLAGGDQQLRQRGLGVEVGDPLEVVVREVGEVDLVEDLAVRRRVRLRRAGPRAALEGIGETAQRARRALGVDRRVDDAVGEVEVVLRMGVEEVGKERAEEAQDEGNQGQREQRVEVGAIESEPAEQAAGSRF
jgi:hypothetical protein